MSKAPRENPNYEFQPPAEGWHTVCVLEGIDWTIKDDVKNSLRIPLAIDEGGEDDGKQVSFFCPYRDKKSGSVSTFGEQKLLDMIGATGLWEQFSEKFPPNDEVNYLTIEKAITALKLKLPGRFCQIRVKVDPEFGPQIVEVLKAGTERPKEKTSKTKTAADKKAEPTSGKAAAPNWD